MTGDSRCENNSTEDFHQVEGLEGRELDFVNHIEGDSQQTVESRLAKLRETQQIWSRIQPGTKNSDNHDGNGDSELTTTLRNWWPRGVKDETTMTELTHKCEIHLRHRRGYTTLAIAVNHGVRDVVDILLKHGASPNTRGYHQTSIVAHASSCLAWTQKNKNEVLYAMIMSCMLLLTDHGGKSLLSVYDEYSSARNYIPKPSLARKRQPKSRLGRLLLDALKGDGVKGVGCLNSTLGEEYMV